MNWSIVVFFTAAILIQGCHTDGSEDGDISFVRNALCAQGECGPTIDDDVESMLAELRRQVRSTDLLNDDIKNKATRKMYKALTGDFVDYCRPEDRQRLWTVPTVPTGVTDVNFDYSGDIDDRQVEVTCRYDMYGTIGPEQRYHCCFLAEARYDVDDAYLEDSRIAIYGSVQWAPGVVMTAGVRTDPFGDGRTSATIGLFGGF